MRRGGENGFNEEWIRRHGSETFKSKVRCVDIVGTVDIHLKRYGNGSAEVMMSRGCEKPQNVV